MKPIIYISGKVTGTDDYEKRFAVIESRLKLQGWHVVNPVKKCKHFPKDTKWETYMRYCIRLLTRCEAIYLLRGWRQSKGAVIEQRLAVDLGLTIISEGKGE
jgi:hypothetical protein